MAKYAIGNGDLGGDGPVCNRQGQLTTALVLLAATALWSGQTWAQSDSQVTAGSLVQEQSGVMNRQQLDLANAVSDGRTKVNIGSIVQQQSGSFNLQQAALGNATGSARATVTVGSLVQSQGGAFNSQKVRIGEASGNGLSQSFCRCRRNIVSLPCLRAGNLEIRQKMASDPVPARCR